MRKNTRSLNFDTPDIDDTTGPEKALASRNLLGSFIRAKRRSLKLTLVTVADSLGCSVGFLSRMELGQVPGGPTLNFLERLADVLEMDLIRLVDLKEEDAKATQERNDRLDGDLASMTELERQMLVNFRATDDRLQHYLVEQAQLSRAMGNRAYRVPDITAGLLNAADDPVKSQFEQLAGAYEALGNRLHTLQRLSEALEAFENAEKIYERTGRLAAAGRTWFFKGRVTRELSRDKDDNRSTDEVRYHIATTDYYFSRADRLFQAALEQAHDQALLPEETERIPENLMLWALNDIQTARLFMRDAPPETRAETFRRHKEHASDKQQRARVLYEQWIAELTAHIEASNPLNTQSGFTQFELLAETYHRLASLHSNIAAQEIRYTAILRENGSPSSEDKDGPGTNFQEGAKRLENELAMNREAAHFHQEQYAALFRKAVEARRELARLAVTQETRDRQLNKLANNHLSLAYALEHYSPQTVPYAEVLYQILLAELIDRMLPPEYDPGQRKSLLLLTASTEGDSDLTEEMRTVIRRQVEKKTATVDLGTRQQPLLIYDIEYSAS